MDFLDRLGIDLSSKILMNLEDPSDIVRVSSVSRSWRHFVIANGFCQQLCLRMFPQLSRVSRVIELNKCTVIEPAVGSSHSVELETLEKDHRVYTFLARVCTSSHVYGCIQRAICASSTDSYPGKRVENTLSACRAFYWSSKGQSNPAMPEALTYELVSKFCIITEINICPFEAYFQSGSPIYSAKSVRFRLGYSKTSNDVGKGLPAHSYPSADDKFIWTYTSQEFPMALVRWQHLSGRQKTHVFCLDHIAAPFDSYLSWRDNLRWPTLIGRHKRPGLRQKSDIQKFKLPEPVLCIGGILQIELLGRVQRNKADGLFYICMTYVQVVGRSLSPAFGVEILETSGKFVLLQNKLEKFHDQPIDPIETIARIVQSSAGDLWQIVNRL